MANLVEFLKEMEEGRKLNVSCLLSYLRDDGHEFEKSSRGNGMIKLKDIKAVCIELAEIEKELESYLTALSKSVDD